MAKSHYPDLPPIHVSPNAPASASVGYPSTEQALAMWQMARQYGPQRTQAMIDANAALAFQYMFMQGNR